MSIDKILSRKSALVNPIGELADKISTLSASRSLNDENIGKLVIATESLDTGSEQIVRQVYSNLESSIKAIAMDLGIPAMEHQVEAASLAGMFATNARGFLSGKLKTPDSSAILMQPAVEDGYLERQIYSLEAYDERENRNAQMQSIIYNLLSSRQDEFGELFFPTIIINPNEVGITLSVRLFYVYNDFKRSVTGALANYGRKNIVRAYADASILENELTKVVPVIRTGGANDNTAKFVPVTDVPGWNEVVSKNITVPTAALLIDQNVDLIGISQTDELLNDGIMGPSDNLDTHIKLKRVFLSVAGEFVALDVSHISGSTFNYAPQGNSRNMLLNLDTDSVVLNSKTKDVNGALLSVALAGLATNSVRIQINLTGRVSLDKGDCRVNNGTVGLSIVRLNADNSVVTSGADYTAIESAVLAAEVVGYELTAYRANSNIRQRGQLLDSQTEFSIITVPYRSPISSIMPAISNQEDNAALQNLVTATGIRVSNDAVTSLQRVDTTLKSYSSVATVDGELPNLDMIGQHYVKPVYFDETVDMTDILNSVKSHERIKDVRAALVEVIRYYANEMYLKSEYKAGASVLTGNQGFKPTVIIGTDPVLYNYICADGDLRTLGDSFDVRIVSTLDSRVVGKVYVSFGVFDGSRNSAINPLNFGNMLYSPEVTVQMPVSRQGQVSNELIVSPRYAHVTSLPVLTTLTVTGLDAVAARTEYYTHP